MPGSLLAMPLRLVLISGLVALLGCADERIAGSGEGTDMGEADTGEADTGETELADVDWVHEVEFTPTVLEATPTGVLVGGERFIEVIPDELWDSEADVVALDASGTRLWTAAWDPEQTVPAQIQTLAWDPEGVWVGFDDFHGTCFDWCPGSSLARLDAQGVELWRVGLSDSSNSWAIRPVAGGALVVNAGEDAPHAELRRFDLDGELVWEWSEAGEPPTPGLYTTGVELFEGAVWVVGQIRDYPPEPTQPWIARFDLETGAPLGTVETPLPSGGLWSAVALAGGLAVVADDRVWVLDGGGDWVWTRGLPAGPEQLLGCPFDARADGGSATTCGRLVEALDSDGQLVWSLDGLRSLTAVALGQRLYFAQQEWSVGGRIYAVGID